MITLEHLNINEALYYLGYKGNKPDDNTKQLIGICEEEVLKAAQPKYLYKTFDLVFNEDNIELLGSSVLLRGSDIKEHLKGCEKAVLMCATISSSVDLLIRKTQVTDMAKAIIINSLASVAVEQVCDKVEKKIYNEYKDYFKTFRYSPGYGDLPIDIQGDILNTLNAQKLIGLCTGSTNMLTPVKSVTALIGLSRQPVPKRKRGCLSCNLRETCQYRKVGSRCV